jgi:hypothetical protein
VLKSDSIVDTSIIKQAVDAAGFHQLPAFAAFAASQNDPDSG